MDEHKFIIELEKALSKLPKTQRDDILADYRSHVFEARERGKSDAEIAESLGDPKTLARSFIAEYHIRSLRPTAEGQAVSQTIYHMFRAFLVVTAILLFNFFFMLWPFLFVAFLLLLGWLVAASLAGVSFSAMIAIIFGKLTGGVVLSLPSKFALAFFSLAGVGLGVLLALLAWILSKWFLNFLLVYIKTNLKVMGAKGEE